MEIDTTKLKSSISSLEALLNEYEEIKLNLFNQLKNSVINWQDGNSIQFDNAIYVEKQEAEKFYDSLVNKKELFQTIYDKYSEFGKKISCKLGNKTALLRTIDYCINYANYAINEFNYIDTGFSYGELNSIMNQKGKIEQVKTDLTALRSQVSEIFNKIENIEVEIRGKVRELEENHIPEFIFTLV